LAASGASTYVGNNDKGLFDVTEIKESLIIGNGKSSNATKFLTSSNEQYIKTWYTLNITLPDYKYRPDSNVNLFSVIKALDLGWQKSN